MKTITRISLATATFALLLAAPIASAQQTRTNTTVAATTTRQSQTTSTSTARALVTNQDELRASIQAQKSGFQTKIQALTPTKKIKLEGPAKDRVTGRINSVFNNLTVRVARLQSADQKLAIRIQEANRAGIKVTAATTLYFQAQTLFAISRVNLEAGRATATEEINGETSKEALRLLVSTTETNIKASAETYRKSLNALETAIQMTAPVTGTSTVPTSVNGTASSSSSVSNTNGR